MAKYKQSKSPWETGKDICNLYLVDDLNIKEPVKKIEKEKANNPTEKWAKHLNKKLMALTLCKGSQNPIHKKNCKLKLYWHTQKKLV